MTKKIKDLESRLASLQSDLEFVRHSGALREVENYLENDITTLSGCLVACSAYDRASMIGNFPHIGMVL